MPGMARKPFRAATSCSPVRCLLATCGGGERRAGRVPRRAGVPAGGGGWRSVAVLLAAGGMAAAPTPLHQAPALAAAPGSRLVVAEPRKSLHGGGLLPWSASGWEGLENRCPLGLAVRYCGERGIGISFSVMKAGRGKGRSLLLWRRGLMVPSHGRFRSRPRRCVSWTGSYSGSHAGRGKRAVRGSPSRVSPWRGRRRGGSPPCREARPEPRFTRECLGSAPGSRCQFPH